MKVFCAKQDVCLEGWICDEVGGVAEFGDSYFNFSDILQDLQKNAPVGAIFQWQQESIDYHFANPDSDKEINYNSYLMGARITDVPRKRTPEEIAEYERREGEMMADFKEMMNNAIRKQ